MHSSGARQLHTPHTNEDKQGHGSRASYVQAQRAAAKTAPRHRQQPAKGDRQKKSAPVQKQVANGSKNMPSILRRGNIYFLVENSAGQYRMPIAYTVTVALVFACALMIILTQAYLAGMERQIRQYEQALRAADDDNDRLTAALSRRYSLEEIEYLATTQLGMIHPDPSQIIEIYVPLQNHVTLNRSADLLPQENYFWNDIRTFVGGLFNRFFGRDTD